MTIENMLTSALRDLAKPTEDERRNAEARVAVLREELQDTTEQRRIADLGDLLDAEDALYDEAIDALERGDVALAERLLRHCAALGDPAAEELLADLASQPRPQPEPHEVPKEERPSDTLCTTSLTGADGRLQRLAGTAVPAHARILMVHPEPEVFRDLFVEACRSAVSLRGMEAAERCSWAHETQRFLADLALHRTTLKDNRAFERRVSSLLLECQRSVSDCSPDASLHIGGKVWSIYAKVSRFGSYRKDRGLLDAFVTQGLWQCALSAQERPAHSGRVAADVLTPYPMPHVDINDHIADALDRLLAGGHDALPVSEHGTVLGTVTLADLAGQVRSDGLSRKVVSVMRPPIYIQENASLNEVRDQLLNSSTGLLVVLRNDGTVAGYVTAGTALAGQTDAPTPRRSALLTGCDGELILA
ncbi:CBS domain-containing protein [Nonomuraea sp. NPDC003214]